MSLENSILMSVGGLTLDPVTKTPIVILKDRDNKLNLPIWIGLLEATAMATELEGIKMARPMTHDLLRNVLAELGATVECIEITDLKDNTYFALIHLLINGARMARASAAAPTTPAAGPDRIVRIGSSRASSTPVALPLDCMMRNRDVARLRCRLFRCVAIFGAT